MGDNINQPVPDLQYLISMDMQAILVEREVYISNFKDIMLLYHIDSIAELNSLERRWNFI